MSALSDYRSLFLKGKFKEVVEIRPKVIEECEIKILDRIKRFGTPVSMFLSTWKTLEANIDANPDSSLFWDLKNILIFLMNKYHVIQILSPKHLLAGDVTLFCQRIKGKLQTSPVKVAEVIKGGRVKIYWISDYPEEEYPESAFEHTFTVSNFKYAFRQVGNPIDEHTPSTLISRTFFFFNT